MQVDDTWQEFVGEEVVDADAVCIGTLSCYWERADGLPTLLGIECENDRLVHVAPARGAQLNQRRAYIQLPFTRSAVLGAPCLDCDQDLREPFARTVYAHYGVRSRGAREIESLRREPVPKSGS